MGSIRPLSGPNNECRLELPRLPPPSWAYMASHSHFPALRWPRRTSMLRLFPTTGVTRCQCPGGKYSSEPAMRSKRSAPVKPCGTARADTSFSASCSARLRALSKRPREVTSAVAGLVAARCCHSFEPRSCMVKLCTASQCHSATSPPVREM